MRFNIVNTSGETWPFLAIGRLGAVAETAGADDEIPIYELVKPDGEAGIYIVNVGSAVADDGYGVGVTFDEVTHVRVSGPDVNLGSIVGPTVDSWFASVAGDGIVVLNSSVDAPLGIVAAMQATDVRLEAMLLTDLDSVDDPRDMPSSATFVVLKELADGTLVNLENDGTPVTGTVYHRLSFAIPAGTYIQVERMAGRWRPYVANCTSSESSESSA